MDKHLDAEALSDYAEGLSGTGARAAADAHLAACAQCRRELAAIQAYFRDMADLEPARAPADFLAKVRSRLPQPSPWERAWTALLLPFRSIPVPIAVAVILGVTAITVYMRQGGPENHILVPAPAAGSASESDSGSTSGSAGSAADRNPPSASQPALKDVGPAEGGSAPSTPPPAPAIAPKAVLSGRPAFRTGSASARSKAQPMGRKQAESSRPEPLQTNPSAGSAEAATASPVPAAAASAPAAPAPTSSVPKSPAPARPPAAGAPPKLSDVEVEGWLDNPSSVYILDNSQPAQNLPLDKTMPVEDGAAVPGQAEAAAGHSAAKRKAQANKAEEKAAPAVLPASGYALSLRAKSDTAAVLAGLRSMGVEAESEYASPGESRFRLSVPAPMLRELGPYLARHGESHPEGRLPSAASASVLSIRLRLLFPAR